MNKGERKRVYCCRCQTCVGLGYPGLLKKDVAYICTRCQKKIIEIENFLIEKLKEIDVLKEKTKVIDDMLNNGGDFFDILGIKNPLK
ncbi:hypothetical protein KKB69_02930 [Patescibacteria group bacterium]|nr:hypothetical protein [Patescibacteria group bacterium]